MYTAPYRAKLLLISFAALGGCSSPAELSEDRRSTAPATEFSAEDKRIARALSIGGNEIQKTGTPQYQAMLCSMALADIRDKIQDSGVLSVEQQKVFAHAENVYRDRLNTGLDDQVRQQARKDVEATYPEKSDRVRFAVGCLRDLVS